MVRPAFLVLILAFSAALFNSFGGGKAGTSSTTSTGASAEVLYLISNGAITTYSVDPISLSITPVGQPVVISQLQSLIQLVTSPNGHFIYLLWSDMNSSAHLSVYSTDSSGVPQNPPIQTFAAKSLFQLNFHPSGKFAYALQLDSSNGQYGSSSSAEYTAYVRLFHANPKTGILEESEILEGTYGPNYYWPVSLYGLSSDGKSVFLSYNGAQGSAFLVRSINISSGVLGPNVNLFGQTGGWQTVNQVVIGSKLLVDLDQQGASGYLDVFMNPPGKSKPLIHCTSAMLALCQSASGLQLDPSGGYLFLTDPSSLQTDIYRIDLSGRKIGNTGSSLPQTTYTSGFFFSPDGKLIYASLAIDNSLHIYRFNSRTGQITPSPNSIPLPVGNVALCPATRNE